MVSRRLTRGKAMHIGYMFSNYEEYGPTSIKIFSPDADLIAATAEWLEWRWSGHKDALFDVVQEYQDRLRHILDNKEFEDNEATDVLVGWGGLQITKLILASNDGAKR